MLRVQHLHWLWGKMQDTVYSGLPMSDGKSKTIYIPSVAEKSKTMYTAVCQCLTDKARQYIFRSVCLCLTEKASQYIHGLSMSDGKKHGLFINYFVTEKMFGETLRVIFSTCCYI
jgi:hypothetical protein